MQATTRNFPQAAHASRRGPGNNRTFLLPPPLIVYYERVLHALISLWALHRIVGRLALLTSRLRFGVQDLSTHLPIRKAKR